MVDTSPSARMQLVGIGDLVNPGCCMVCGSGVREEGYVDLRTYFDYEGQMYLCHTCIEQASELIGCLLPRETTVLQEQVQAVLANNAELRTELEAAYVRLNAWDTLIGDRSSIATSPDRSTTTDSSNESADKHSNTEPVDAAASSGEPVAQESVTVSRRNDAKRSGSRNTPEGISSLNL